MERKKGAKNKVGREGKKERERGRETREEQGEKEREKDTGTYSTGAEWRPLGVTLFNFFYLFMYTYTAADMLFSTGPLSGHACPERPCPLALRAHLRCGGGPTFPHCLELVWLSCARSPAPGASRSLRYSVCLGPRPRPRTPNLH